MRRVVIVGNSGSGKTTLARIVAARLAVTHLELDALYHQPDWTPLPLEEFVDQVRNALDAADLAGGGWVVCGNYRAVQAAIWARADTVVWLDLPRALVMWQVTRRSLLRVVRRTELWNANRERLRDLLALHDPGRSLIRWTWDGVAAYRVRYAPAMVAPTWAGVRWAHLTSRRDVAEWVGTVLPCERSGPGAAGELA